MMLRSILARPRKPLRVRVTLEIEVDRDAYDAEYNEPASADDIRGHIKGGVYSAAESDFRNIRAIKVLHVR